MMKTEKWLRGMILAALLVALGLGLALTFWPKISGSTRQEYTKQILDGVEEGKTTAVVPANLLPVSGEEEDFSDLSLLDGEDADEWEKKQLTVLGVLSIDSIDLKLPIFDGIGKVPLRFGAGRLKVSAELGGVGVSALLGHRMLNDGELFNRMGDVAVGDKVRVTLSGPVPQEIRYTVDHINVVPKADITDEIYTPVEGDWIVLVTCDPPGVADHRLAIWCKQATE